MLTGKFALLQSVAGDNNNLLNLTRGDLVILEKGNGDTLLTQGWCPGYCERTRQRGNCRLDYVYVLPTLDKPQRDILV